MIHSMFKVKRVLLWSIKQKWFCFSFKFRSSQLWVDPKCQAWLSERQQRWWRRRYRSRRRETLRLEQSRLNKEIAFKRVKIVKYKQELYKLSRKTEKYFWKSFDKFCFKICFSGFSFALSHFLSWIQENNIEIGLKPKFKKVFEYFLRILLFQVCQKDCVRLKKCKCDLFFLVKIKPNVF